MAESGSGSAATHRVPLEGVSPPGHGKSLKRRAMETGFWTIGGFGLQSVFRLGSNLILARLLAPEDFGIIAIAFTIYTGLAMFSDVGLNQNAIQSENGDDPDFLNTLWTIQIIRGFVIAAGLWMIAAALAFTSLPALFPVSSVYRASEIPGLIALIAFISLIDGFTPTKAITAHRHMQIGRVSTIQLAAQVVGSLGTICAAYLGADVWAFSIGAVLTALLALFLKHFWIVGANNRFALKTHLAKNIYNFGKWIFLSSIVGFVGAQGSNFLYGAALPSSAFGIFTIALIWVSGMQSILESISQSIVFPAIALKKNESDLQIALKKSRPYFYIFSFTSIFLCIVIFKLSDFVKEFYPIDYTIQYYMKIISIMIATYPGRCFIFLWTVQGDSKRVFICNLSKISSLCACFYLLTAGKVEDAIIIGSSPFVFSNILNFFWSFKHNTISEWKIPIFFEMLKSLFFLTIWIKFV